MAKTEVLQDAAEEPPHQPPPIELAGDGAFRVHLPAGNYLSLLGPHRRGEVAMLIERVPGWLLLQTKSHYPAGVFRVPTGTIAPGESSDAALVRELLEEANLTPRSYWRLFRLCYTVDGGRNDFFSDAYVIQQPEGMLKPNDLDEQISGWREAQVSELETVADDLCCLEPPRHDWGKFRAVLHRLAAQHLHPQQESE